MRESSWPVSRALSVLVLVAMCMALGIMLQGVWRDWRYTVDAVHDNVLATTHTCVARQQELMATTRALLETLALTKAVQEEDSAVLAALLMDLNKEYPHYFGFSLLRTDGSTVLEVVRGRVQPSRRQPSRHPLVARTLATEMFSHGNYSTRSPSDAFFPMAQPVFNREGEVIFLLVASFDLGQFDNVFSTLRTVPDVSLVLLDQHKTVMFSYPPQPEVERGTRMSQGVLSEALDSSADLTVVKAPDRKGELRMFAVRAVRLRAEDVPYMYMVVGQPQPSFINFLSRHYTGQLVAIVGALLFALLVARVMGRRLFVFGLGRLAQVAAAREQGDRTARNGEVPGCREIQVVARSVDCMLDELDERERELRMQVERLNMIMQGGGLGAWGWQPHLATLTMDVRACRMVGFADNMSGLPIDVELLHRHCDECVHPEDVAALYAFVTAPEGTQVKGECQVRIRRGEGWGWVVFWGQLMGQQTPQSIVGVVRDNTHQKRLEQMEHAQVEHYRMLSNTDGLTGLWNRRYLQQIAGQECLRVARYGGTFTLVMGDLDFFKRINDSFGHAAGDALLVRVADVLRDSLRTCDVVARYGGEEFALLLPETDAAAARIALERVRECIARQVLEFDGQQIQCTISFGACAMTPKALTPKDTHADEADALCEQGIREADRALYASKQQGRNRVSICELPSGSVSL